jgi:nitroreductase
MQAASARNQQPWQFIVIDDGAMPAEIAGFVPAAAMVAKAPLAILVCGNLSLRKSPRYLSGVRSCFARLAKPIGTVNLRGRCA